MAAWGIEISDLGEGADLGMGERISLGIKIELYFTKDEREVMAELAPFRSAEEVDRLMLPENYEEWRDVVSAMFDATLYTVLPDAAEINGERVDMPTRVSGEEDPDNVQWVEFTPENMEKVVAALESEFGPLSES
jgi:hypothetical protein